MDRTPRICNSAGHGLGSRTAGQVDPGAEVVGPGNEASYALGIAARVDADMRALFAGVSGSLHMLRDAGLYYKVDDEAYAKGVDLLLEHHFNSGAGSARADGREIGTEVLYNDPNDQPFADALSEDIARAAGVPDRGAKRRTDLAVLAPKAGMVQVIVEHVFGSDADDVAAYNAHIDAVELAIVNRCLRKWGWEPVTSLPRKWSESQRAAYAKVRWAA